jgi:hypothetical protein
MLANTISHPLFEEKGEGFENGKDCCGYWCLAFNLNLSLQSLTNIT